MIKRIVLPLLLAFVGGQATWSQVLVDREEIEPAPKARITDVGLVVGEFETKLRYDSLQQRMDTLIHATPRTLWKSAGEEIIDTAAIARRCMQRMMARRRAADAEQKGAALDQSGNLMESMFLSFYYYVFRFEYPSIDADGKPITLSGMAACPTWFGTSEVHNVIIGPHITITSDAERPSARTNNFDETDWGMLMSLAGGPKMLIKESNQKWLPVAAAVSWLIPGVGLITGTIASAVILTVEIDQICKYKNYHDYNYNLVIMPDYEGYGVTRERAHPYLYQELTARQVVDGVKAGIELYKSSTSLSDIRHPIRSDFRTISCGYSQGGSVSMATHRFIEQNNLDKELHFTGSICGDGPYDAISTLMYYIKQERDGKPLSMGVVLPLIVKGMLDTNPYMKNHKPSDYFQQKFLDTGIMDWLSSKEMNTTDIDHRFASLARYGRIGDPNYFSDILNEDGTSYLSKVMKPECLEYFSRLYDKYEIKDKVFPEYPGAGGIIIVGGPQPTTADIPLPTQRGVYEDLHFALASNDMTIGWKPLHKLLLFHSKYDTVVPYDNALKAKDHLGDILDLTTSGNDHDHVDAGTDFFKGDNNMQLVTNGINLRLYNWVDKLCNEKW